MLDQTITVDEAMELAAEFRKRGPATAAEIVAAVLYREVDRWRTLESDAKFAQTAGQLGRSALLDHENSELRGKLDALRAAVTAIIMADSGEEDFGALQDAFEASK